MTKMPRARKPEPYIYLFSLPANLLRQLSDVYRRERSVASVEGIQRAIEGSRTSRIRQYIEYGYPFGDLNHSKRAQNEHLRKPGWIPTAIVVNVITQDDIRHGRTILQEHMVTIERQDDHFYLNVPSIDSLSSNDLRPFEVIDGQHRLWSFDEDDELNTFEVPVVAFQGLDIAWQAYLFWSINISPKRINPSHAFDLYPLLRTQDWLEETGEIRVYREARAQEITEQLYLHPSSPWFDRISMLQRRGEPRVSQAAWIRSLLGSFFGSGRGRARYGLFQVPLINHDSPLAWERVQQIAFIMQFWNSLKEHIHNGEHAWIHLYRNDDKDAFEDKSSMLNQDMGLRAVNAVLNDIFFIQAHTWKLTEWRIDVEDKSVLTEKDVEHAVKALTRQNFYAHVKQLAELVASFDWRSLEGPSVRSSDDEILKRAYRGSGGYTLLTRNLCDHVSKKRNAVAKTAATIVFD